MEKKDLKESKKVLKEALANEVRPLLIGMREELKRINQSTISLFQKEIKRNALELVVNGKEIPFLRGEDGKTPVKGQDYFTEDEKKEFVAKATPQKGVDYLTKTELEEIKREARPIKGKDYFTIRELKNFLIKATPVKGKHYFTKKEIADFKKEATPIKGKDYFDGKDGITKTITEFIDMSAEKVRDKLESLRGTARLRIEAIKGLREELDQLWKRKEPQAGGYGGIATLASGGVNVENLNAQISGGNRVFAVSSTPKVVVVDQSRVMVQNDGWTLSGLTLTVDVEPTFSIFIIY